ncbi:MAG TPA: pyridoxamine 5'-phosphate oxidase family protein [Anaerohalosphaeraceae bacterium]|jgi:hypothetical protein|nr:pyridoxamine 5'-phosphate oxidase family protein [Anaerohalosphaeraceae bacterium]
MDLARYFNMHEGTGVLATCDIHGWVDGAVYAKPHVVDSSTVAFVMKERLSHKNLKTNLHACYLFLEQGPGYKGLRLYLTLLRMEVNQTLVQALRQKQPVIYPSADDSKKFVVFFHVEQTRPLVGDHPLSPSEP